MRKPKGGACTVQAQARSHRGVSGMAQAKAWPCPDQLVGCGAVQARSQAPRLDMHGVGE